MKFLVAIFLFVFTLVSLLSEAPLVSMKEGKEDFVITREGFSLGFSKQYRQPLWVVYKLTRENIETKNAVRDNKFKADPLLKEFSPLPSEYKDTGYDKGHLAPAADMTYSVVAMDNSFFMSNISPQKPQFNRGIWLRLEKQVRDFAVSEKVIYVITGPIFKKDDILAISIGKENSIPVPYAYYKVIYDLTHPQKMIAFIIQNTGSKKNITQFAVSVSTVERLTGLTFFPNIPNEEKEKLENNLCVGDWLWLEEKKR